MFQMSWKKMANGISLFGHDRAVRQLLFIILFVTFIIGVPSLFYPFGRDQGIHAHVGAEILKWNLLSMQSI